MYALIITWILVGGDHRAAPVAIFASKEACQKQLPAALNYKMGQLAGLGHPEAADSMNAWCVSAFISGGTGT